QGEDKWSEYAHANRQPRACGRSARIGSPDVQIAQQEEIRNRHDQTSKQPYVGGAAGVVTQQIVQILERLKGNELERVGMDLDVGASGRPLHVFLERNGWMTDHLHD